MMLIAKLRDNWFKYLTWFWIFFIASSDLKVNVDPHIHWIGTGVIALLILPFLLKHRSDILTNFKNIQHGYSNPIILYFISVSFFIFGLLLSSIHSPNYIYGLAETIKLIVILIGATFIFILIPKIVYLAFDALEFSTFINIILILMGILLIPSLADMMFSGRWGTILNFPGSLWKVGIATFFYGAYRSFTDVNNKFKSILLLLSSMFLIYFDGARTGLILLLLGIFLVLVLFIKERRYKSTILSLLFFIIIIAGFNFINVPTLHSKVKPGALQRFDSTIHAKDLQDADSARYQMLNDAWKAIITHPIMGTGIGTTKTNTQGGRMVIHMTYLQVWADMGIISFLSYIALIIGWFFWFPNIFIKISNKVNHNERAIYLNAVYMLICFAITGLFNPLSTEWSDWLYFFIPYAFISQLLTTQIDNKNEISA